MAQTDQTKLDSGSEQEKSLGRPPAAALIRKALLQSRILGIRIIGHPGCGKTELIEATLKRLSAPKRAAVIVVNPASSRDSDRLRDSCGQVAHVDAAVPTAAAIWAALSEFKLENVDTLLIEAAGGLAPLTDLGQDATVAAFAISGGDDKAAEYRGLIKISSAIVLTKTDLRPLIKFDGQVFRNDVRAVNGSADVYELSATSGAGMAEWLGWIDRKRIAKATTRGRAESPDWSTDTFLG
jgi:hydrogenase nickel incorporation protein HypB